MATQQWLQEQKASALEKRRIEVSCIREENCRRRASPLSPPFDYLCQFCTLYNDTMDDMDDHHNVFQGCLFFALEEGLGGRMSQKWDSQFREGEIYSYIRGHRRQNSYICNYYVNRREVGIKKQFNAEHGQ